MNYLILAVIGLAVMLFALVMLARNWGLKLNGIETEAEVIGISEETRKAKGGRVVSGYVHTLRYEANGKIIEAKDKTGYMQPLSKGSKQTIIYSKTNPEIFEYAEQIERNIKMMIGFAAVGAVFAVRFFMLGMK